MEREYYLGLMAGTSLDAIDCALVSFDSSEKYQLVHHYSEPISASNKAKLLSLTKAQDNELELLIEMDVRLGRLFAQACLNTLKEAKLSKKNITAIGSHGQTIRHFPQGNFRSSLQIGDANIIAELTGITTISDFRRRDMAAGGQGAPLVPPFHAALFRDDKDDRCVVNIGGIANITCLPAAQTKEVIGFDTGPGNTLMDLWCHQTLGKNFDNGGKLARQGKIIPELLKQFLADQYFSMPHPKSTGREYFGQLWLKKNGLEEKGLEEKGFKEKGQEKKGLLENSFAIDLLSTLTELTAISISDQIKQVIPQAKEVLICGGGSKNKYLLERLSTQMKDKKILSTAAHGLPADSVESVAFAWLAMKTMKRQAGNLPSVTGAQHPVILGAIYPGDGSI